jgi:uncharacterized protein
MAVVIFKAVERCNSNCIYCDVIKHGQKIIMDFELLELVFERIDEYLAEDQHRDITFTWHGGEVGLLGADYFLRAAELQEKHCSGTKDRINHQMQSNLTLVNQRFLDAVQQLGIDQIGSSFDPLPNIRGLGSRRDSTAYNRKFFEGVELLEANNFTWGVIYVVHRRSLPKPLDIFHYLTNLNLRTQPNFNQIYVHGSDEHNLDITGEEFADFLGAIFPVWWQHRDRYPEVRPFSSLVRNAHDGGKSLVCDRSGNCAFGWVYVGPDGVTSQCGRAGDFKRFSYGKIQERSLSEVLQDSRRNRLLDRVAHLQETECAGCRFWGICHGGCILDSFDDDGDCMHRMKNCDGLRVFMERYFEPITGLRFDMPPDGLGKVHENAAFS